MRKYLINFKNLKICSNLFNKNYNIFEHQTIKFLNTNSTTTIINNNSELNEKATGLVKSIIEEYKNKEKILVLPWADQQAINSALFPFKELLKIGIRPEFLEDACSQYEQLFRLMIKNGQKIYQMLNVIVENFHISFEDAIRIFAKISDFIEDETPQTIQSRFNLFSSRGIATGSNLRRLFEKYPELFFASQVQQMDNCLEHITQFFDSDNLKSVVLIAPHICLMDPIELEKKYEYIYFHFGFISEELAKSKNWMDLDLFSIIDRHQFLIKTGKYFYPDPKRPQLKKENPSASLIFDTPEFNFATLVGCVEHEEWLMFRELSEQKRLLEDLDEPFEKIKPALRKMYERRAKEEREYQEGEI